jgi:sugar-specific transcriptional regulator TrmB
MQPDFSSRYTSILKPLGLSDYEIRVFLTLIEIGPTNYRILVRESNVPTGKIYQVLSTLESKGFIEVVRGKPKLFRATEPKKAFSRRLRKMEEDYLDLELRIREGLQNLQFEYSQRYDNAQGTVTEIMVGSNSFERVIKENLPRAEDEVLISSIELISRLHLEELIKDLRLKGVSINATCPRLPATDNGISKDLIGKLEGLGVKIRVLESIPSKYLIVDNRSVSLFIDGYEDETCILIQSPALCQVLRESFMLKWETGRTLTQNDKNHALNSKSQKPYDDFKQNWGDGKTYSKSH